jgi:hypothetical protein
VTDPTVETSKLERFFEEPKRRKGETIEPHPPFQETLVSVINWICLQSKQYNEDCLERIKDSSFLETTNPMNKGKKPKN